MLRITEIPETDGTVRLRLDGTLSGSSFEELTRACARYRGPEIESITLDMSGLEFMSNDAAFKVAALRGDRLKLVNCSAFIEMLIENVTGEKHRHGSEDSNGKKAGR